MHQQRREANKNFSTLVLEDDLFNQERIVIMLKQLTALAS